MVCTSIASIFFRPRLPLDCSKGHLQRLINICQYPQKQQLCVLPSIRFTYLSKKAIFNQYNLSFIQSSNLNLQLVQRDVVFTMLFNLSTDAVKENKLTHYDKEQQRIFHIITGKLKYPANDFRDFDLAPDLVIKITVPNAEYIPRSDYLELSSYVAFPSQKLERAFQKGEKIVLEEMNRKRQNIDPSNLRIRLQKALVPSQLTIKTTNFVNEYNEQEQLEIESVYKHSGDLDCFSLEYNTIIYILQHQCGFRVRSFLLYDQKQQNREIFLFLTLSSENLVNLAKRYRIKKEIDYTFVDFFLNDPTGPDQRPLKYASSIKTDGILQSQIKSINRYFRVGNTSHETTDIIEEADLSDQQKIDFRDYLEEVTEVFEYYKYKCGKEISNKEKSYIFQYNRRKINKGCEDMFALIKQRQEFFQINKRVLERYGYSWDNEPLVYQEFHLPDKQSKNSSFFEKLYSLLLYKPMVVSEYGDLDLFLNMERSKLSYLIIKNNFKVSYLKKMGFDFLALSNNFQKFGGQGQIKGGINGKNLQSEWSAYGLFSNIDTIRNYVGDSVGFQILITNQLILYFLFIFVPFAMLYVIEEVLGTSFYIYTTLIETLIYAISYQVYLFYWGLSEREYIKNYSDSVSSKIFLNQYRGPYRRNFLTDEVNQFQTVSGVASSLVNTLCAIIIITLLVIMGGVFHGCRMLLLAIYDPLSHLVVSRVSLPHIVAYLVFFVAIDIAALLATNRLISLMVHLQNPPTDEEEEKWRSTLRFFYLVGLELIPPFFFFIIEPFSGNSCYSNDCLSEIEFYVYSRMLITFLISAVRLSQVFIFNYLYMKQFLKKNPPVIYQDKLSNLLSKALRESKKKEHTIKFNETIILIISFSIYSNILPLVSILSLLAFFMQYTNTRLGILYEQRRPINRSQRILPFSRSASTIFYIGILLQAWVSVFLFQFVESHFQIFIERVSTTVTYQGIFLFKLVCVFIYFLLLLSISKIAGSLAQGYTNDALLKRKDNKFKEFLASRGRMKIQVRKPYQPLPLKAIFRSFDPEKTNQQQLHDLLFGRQTSIPSAVGEEDMQNLDSLINITFKNLK